MDDKLLNFLGKWLSDWRQQVRKYSGVTEYMRGIKKEKMIEAITKLLQKEQKKILPQSGVELLFTLSSKAYRQLNNECDCKRLGMRPCEINQFCSEFGSTRILKGKDQSDDILIYRKFK